jgi:hypothetical protein
MSENHPHEPNWLNEHLSNLPPSRTPLVKFGFWIGFGVTLGVVWAMALISFLGLMLFAVPAILRAFRALF